MWCLLEATHKECFLPVKTGRGVTIVRLLPGQLINGRHASARKIRCKPSTGAALLKKLSDIGKIDTQPGTHFTIVTLKNWDTYQVQEKKDHQDDLADRLLSGRRQHDPGDDVSRLLIGI